MLQHGRSYGYRGCDHEYYGELAGNMRRTDCQPHSKRRHSLHMVGWCHRNRYQYCRCFSCYNHFLYSYRNYRGLYRYCRINRYCNSNACCNGNITYYL